MKRVLATTRLLIENQKKKEETTFIWNFSNEQAYNQPRGWSLSASLSMIIEPPETPQLAQHYDEQGVKVSLQLGFHYAEEKKIQSKKRKIQ